MSNVDFMKVFDSAAASLNAAAHLSVEAIDINRYAAAMIRDNGTQIIITADLAEFEIILSIEKKFMILADYRKFLSTFEFNLEQRFFKNIDLVTNETGREYKIKISF